MAASVLGHDSTDTTSRYLGLARDDLKRAYDRAVEGILDPEREAGELASDGGLTAPRRCVGYRARRANR